MSKIFSNRKGIVNVRKTTLPVVRADAPKQISAKQIAQVTSAPAKDIKTMAKGSGMTEISAKPVLTDMNQKVKKFISLKI